MSDNTHPALEALRDIAKRMQRSAGGGSTTKSRESIRLRAKQAIPALEALIEERDRLLQENRDYRTGPSFSRLLRERDELQEKLRQVGEALGCSDASLFVIRAAFLRRERATLQKERDELWRMSQ